MKQSCIGLLLSVLAVAPAFAAGIVVDGDISDWPATAKQTGLIINNSGGSFQIAKYGAMVQGGTLYGFVEVQAAMGVPGGTPDGNVYPGIYIDVDNSTATSVGNVSGYVPAGVDINVEVDYDTGAIPSGGGPAGHAVNLWGTATPEFPAGDWRNGSVASSGVDAHNAAQTIFEWSCPVSEITAAVATGAVGAPENWKIYVGGEGGPTWGRTVGQVGTVVDGDISDWPDVTRRTGPLFNKIAGNAFQVLQYGTKIQNGTLFAFVELESPVGIPNGTPAGKAYPGVYIDIDSDIATGLGNLSGYVPAGIDINVEVDYDTKTIPEGGGAAGHAVNLWGTATLAFPAGDWDGSIACSGVDAHNAAQTIFEWSVPISEVTAAVANGAVGDPENWKMYVGGAARPDYVRMAGEVGILVDGDLSDWQPKDKRKCPILVNQKIANQAFQLSQYGAQVRGDMLYAFVELAAPIGIPGGSPDGKNYPGVFIDIDNNPATSVGNLSSWIPQGMGFDINVEVDYDTKTIPDGGGTAGHAVNLWGTATPAYPAGDWGDGSVATSGVDAHNAAQTIFEWAVPISEITNAVADGAVGDPANWKFYVGGQGKTTTTVPLRVYGYMVGEVGILVDGDISDWQPKDKRIGTIYLNKNGSFQLSQYGAHVRGDTLFAFVEVQNPIPIPGGNPSGNAYPGVFIDIDNNTQTIVGHRSSWIPANMGIDINVEVDYDTAAIPEGGGTAGHAVNLWGTATPAYPAGDWKDGSVATSGVDAHNASQTVFEWSIPISEVIAAVADGAVAGDPKDWRMYVGGQCSPIWGYHVGLVIPHPERTCVLMVK